MEIGELNNRDIDPMRFFILSFRYSQGSQSFHDVIFNYFASLGVKANIPEVPNEVLENLKIPIKHKKKEKLTTVEESFVKQWRSMKNRLDNINNQYSLEQSEGYLNEIVDYCLKRDEQYLGKGRDGRDINKSREPDDENDPWMSFTRKYGLQGDSTGHFLFDYLFKKVGIEVQHLLEIDDARAVQLKNLWEKKHNGEKFN